MQRRTTSALRSARLALLGLTILASGCVYHVATQQGNFLQKRDVDQLQVGMTRAQVRYLLGTPMVPAMFDNDRWDYLYYLKASRWRHPLEELLTVYFENDKVVRFNANGRIENSKSVVPEAGPRPQT